VFVTPDNCLPEVRTALIAAGRPLLQTIAVAMGFNFVAAGSIRAGDHRFAGTLDGAQILAEKVTLEAVRELGALDFVVTGACAVDALTGVRYGKGHGFFDTEWAVMSELGIVNERTPVVACVHDVQVVDSGLTPSAHDTAVDWILTPTRTLEVTNRHPNPSGVHWDIVDEERLAEIEPLRDLHGRAGSASRASSGS
jgi:5-formyltetrahydrofolate cyclo-ligase